MKIKIYYLTSLSNLSSAATAGYIRIQADNEITSGILKLPSSDYLLDPEKTKEYVEKNINNLLFAPDFSMLTVEEVYENNLKISPQKIGEFETDSIEEAKQHIVNLTTKLPDLLPELFL